MEAQSEALMVTLETMGDCAQAPPMQTGKSDTDLPLLSSDAKERSMPALGGNIKPYQFFGERIRRSSHPLVALRERVRSTRSERRSWGPQAWFRAVQLVRAEGTWGASTRGGPRKGRGKGRGMAAPQQQQAGASNNCKPAIGGNIHKTQQDSAQWRRHKKNSA